MTGRPLSLDAIADFDLAKLPDPKAGFFIDEEAWARKIANQPPGRGKRRRAAENILDRIDTEKQRIHGLLEGIPLPAEVAKDPFLPDLVQGAIKENPREEDTSNPLIGRARILPFRARCTDMAKETERINAVAIKLVREKIQGGDTAEEDSEAFKNACRAVRNALLMRIHDNILVTDNHPLISMEFGKIRPEHPHRVSTRTVRGEVKKIIAKVERGELNNEKACIELVNVLLPADGRLTTFEERDDFLQIDMPDTLGRATELYKSIARRLQAAQREFEIDGEQITVDIAEENEYQNIVELLGTVVNHSQKTENLDEMELKRLSEAQTLATLAYLFHYVRKHPYYKGSLAEERRFRRQFMKTLFPNGEKIEETVEVPTDKKGNILPDQNGAPRYHKVGLRKIQIPEWQTLDPQRIYLEGIRRKQARAIVKKLLLNPETELEGLFDFLGGRVFLWDISKSDLDDPAKGPAIKQDLLDLAEKMGESVGSKLAYKPREQLLRGEFCIEDKIDANLGNDKSHEFPALKVYGISPNGYPFEFQIVLKDGYNSSKSKGSPNHEDFYEMEKDFRLAELFFPESIYPKIKEVKRRGQAALKRRKETWQREHHEATSSI